MKNTIEKIVSWKVNLDRARVYISYFQLFMVFIVVLKQFENQFTTFVFAYPYVSFPILFFVFLLASVFVGYLDKKLKIKELEQKNLSNSNPVLMDILRELKNK